MWERSYKQRFISSISSITIFEKPYINQFNGNIGVFNFIFSKESFKTGVLFGKETTTYLYASGHIRAQLSLKNRKFIFGAFCKFSYLNVTGQIGIGNNDLNISLLSWCW